jgi:hypothetical protein
MDLRDTRTTIRWRGSPRRSGLIDASVCVMKFLCLAYGAEKDWGVLSKTKQAELPG